MVLYSVYLSPSSVTMLFQTMHANDTDEEAKHGVLHQILGVLVPKKSPKYVRARLDDTPPTPLRGGRHGLAGTHAGQPADPNN